MRNAACPNYADPKTFGGFESAFPILDKRGIGMSVWNVGGDRVHRDAKMMREAEVLRKIG